MGAMMYTVKIVISFSLEEDSNFHSQIVSNLPTEPEQLWNTW